MVCIGTFDGVHLGHQALIRETVRRAVELECPSVVLTFDRHPLATVAPERFPPAIEPLSENLAIFESLGISAAVVLAFDEQLASRSATEFFETVLVEALRASHVVIGHDFAFGKGREGDAAWLGSRIATSTLEPILVDGKRVSSSQIRRLIQSGDVSDAGKLLGRAVTLGGCVVAGQKVGRTLGFPTLNLARAAETLIPADGVYSGIATGSFGRKIAAVSIGSRPTLDFSNHLVEAHLLDYDGPDLYGQTVQLEVIDRLRGQVKYESLEQLRAGIASDIAEVRRRISDVVNHE